MNRQRRGRSQRGPDGRFCRDIVIFHPRYDEVKGKFDREKARLEQGRLGAMDPTPTAQYAHMNWDHRQFLVGKMTRKMAAMERAREKEYSKMGSAMRRKCDEATYGRRLERERRLEQGSSKRAEPGKAVGERKI